MHIRTTSLQNWERAALTEYAQHSKAFRAASGSVWFALRLRDASSKTPLARPDPNKQRLSFSRPVPLSATPEIETRLYALFAE